jgi:hypothetical protein
MTAAPTPTPATCPPETYDDGEQLWFPGGVNVGSEVVDVVDMTDEELEVVVVTGAALR